VSALGALKAVEADLLAEVEHWHPRLLAQRFATAFVPLFLGLLASYGWRPAWPELWAALPGLLAAAAERAWRSAPWGALLAVVRDAQDAADRPAVPLPAAVGTATLTAPIAPPGS
jgi:hypothetical protein